MGQKSRRNLKLLNEFVRGPIRQAQFINDLEPPRISESRIDLCALVNVVHMISIYLSIKIERYIRPPCEDGLCFVAVLLFAQELFKFLRKGIGRWKFRFRAAVVFVFKHREVADSLIVTLNRSVV